MNNMQFSVKINANKKAVWNTLWQDETFRQWADIIDPGTYMVGDLRERNEVQFLSAGGYGVTSKVEKLAVNELLLLRHQADTKENGKREREKEWTGGEERYLLTEEGDVTTLTVTFGVPAELEEYFKLNYPKALKRVKELTEAGNNT